MTRKRRTYTDKFKRDTVKQVTEPLYLLAEAARNLGVHANLLRTWKQKIAANDERMELANQRVNNHSAVENQNYRQSRWF